MAVIDLHCHLLPGVDDGARDLDESVAMARAAVTGGVEAIVATPHVSRHFPTAPAELAERCAEVQTALDAAAVPLAVHVGAEIAAQVLTELGDDDLRACTLGGGRYLLLEPPYSGPAPFLERMVSDLAGRGFGVVLAHPERIQAFHQDVELLERLVTGGALCSVTTASVSGGWGRAVKRFSEELFRRRLVHNLASDAHDAERRTPALRPLAEAAVAQLPGLEHAIDWLTDSVPRAILAGEQVAGEPPRIEPGGGRRGRLRRR
jgi:protein-tyrosine phosphatase